MDLVSLIWISCILIVLCLGVFYCLLHEKLIFKLWIVMLPFTKVLSLSLSGKTLSLIDSLTFFLGAVLLVKALTHKKHKVIDNEYVKNISNLLLVYFPLGLILTFIGFYQFKEFAHPSWTSDVDSILSKALIVNIRYLTPFCTILIVYSFIKNKEDFKYYSKWFLWSVVLASTYGIYEYIVKVSGLGFGFLLPGHAQSILYWNGLDRVSGPFGEPSYYAGFLVVSALFCLFAIDQKILASRTLLLVLFGIQIALLVLTYSTVGWISFCIGIVIYLISKGKAKFLFLLTVLCSVMLIAIINIPTLNEVISKPLDTDSGSALDRKYTAAVAWEIFKHNPLTGVGNGIYGLVADYYTPDGYARIQEGQPIANNVYLEMLSAYGIFGALLLIVLFVNLGKALLATKILDNNKVFLPYFLATVSSILVIYNAYPTINYTFQWFIYSLIFVTPFVLKKQKAVG